MRPQTKQIGAFCIPFPRDSRDHNQELAASRRQLNDLRESKDEEAGRWEFATKKLKTELDIANQKIKVMRCVCLIVAVREQRIMIQHCSRMHVFMRGFSWPVVLAVMGHGESYRKRR